MTLTKYLPRTIEYINTYVSDKRTKIEAVSLLVKRLIVYGNDRKHSKHISEVLKNELYNLMGAEAMVINTTGQVTGADTYMFWVG